MSKKKNYIEFEPSEICPCESGKLYGKCCSKKSFKWMKDKKGEIYKTISMSNESSDILKAEQEEFERIFGRKPKGNDRVFTAQYFHSPDDFDAGIEKAFEKSGISPELVYAWQKTERIVSEQNKDFLTEKELNECNDAIDEYYKTVEENNEEDPLASIWLELLKSLYDSICHYGSFLLQIPRKQVCPREAFFQYVFSAKMLDTNRTIYRWLSNRYSDDVMILIRAIYENYLRIRYLRKHPAYAYTLIAIDGVYTGGYEWTTKTSGKTNYDVIINKESKKKYKVISIGKMARAGDFPIDIDFHKQLYRMLSNYTHSDLNVSLDYYAHGEGFLLHKNDNPFLGLQWVSIINAILLDELSNIKHVNKIVRCDLNYMSLKLKKYILMLDDIADADNKSELIKTAIKRIKLIGTRRI